MSAGIRYMLIATFFFALMNIGVKSLPRIPSYEIVFFRALVSLVIGYILIRRAGLSPWGNKKSYLILRGLTGTIALIMYFYTLQVMPLATAATLIQLSPIFTIILAGIMVKEPPRPIQWLFFLLAFGGVIMVKGFDARITPGELAIGVTAAFFAGLAYNYIRKLKGHDDPLVVVFYFPLVTVPLVGTYTALHWVQPDPLEWVILILTGVVVTIAQIFMTKAYQLEKAANVSNFTYIGVVLSIIIGWVLFDEGITLLAFTGIGLIIFGVIMATRYKQTA